jgi:DNA-binding GntR family transcriptional regulator
MMTDTLPPVVRELQPTARFVYRELQRAEDNRLTIAALRERTGYSTRGIRHATTALEAEELIESQWRDNDPRQRVFILAHP